MQITLNKIAFDVTPVDAPLRLALLADPGIARATTRDVWAWDKDAAKGRFLAPVTAERGVALPPGLSVFVPRPGAAAERADGPTAKMAERLVQAVGAQSLTAITQALARVVGIPQRRLPFDAFAPLNPLASYRVRLHTDYAVLALANAARNLAAYAFVPSLVVFTHVAEDAPEDAPKPGSIRPGFVLPPANQAALTMRRMATARRVAELQADLGDLKPGDLPPGDPRRDVVARLGAEWKVLAPKAKAA